MRIHGINNLKVSVGSRFLGVSPWGEVTHHDGENIMMQTHSLHGVWEADTERWGVRWLCPTICLRDTPQFLEFLPLGSASWWFHHLTGVLCLVFKSLWLKVHWEPRKIQSVVFLIIPSMLVKTTSLSSLDYLYIYSKINRAYMFGPASDLFVLNLLVYLDSSTIPT